MEDPSTTSIEDHTEKIMRIKRKAVDTLLALFPSPSKASNYSLKRAKRDDDLLDQFKSRMMSFQKANWKSCSELNPRFLAEGGWTIADAEKQTLKCISCKRFLNVRLPDITKVDIQVYRRCLSKVLEGMEGAHELTCTIRTCRSPFFPEIHEKEKMLLHQRLQSFSDISVEPSFKVNGELISPSILRSLFPDEVNEGLATLAVVGFQAYTEKNCARCELCLRQLTLAGLVTPSHYAWCPYMDCRPPSDTPHWRYILMAVYNSRISLPNALTHAQRAISASSIPTIA